jgi:hypothetical protein
MERRLAVAVFAAVAVALGVAAGAVFAQGGAAAHPGANAPGPPGKARDWVDVADIALRAATLAVLSAGIVGTFAVLTSLRSSAYSQIFSRFQSLLLKLVEHPELFERMKREEYTDAEDDPLHPQTTTHPHRFLANCMVNLYEEAFLLYESRVLSVFDPLPRDYWESILGSMRAAFQLKYVRTHWEKRQAVFSPKFNRFVRDQILGFTGVNPSPDVV